MMMMKEEQQCQQLSTFVRAFDQRLLLRALGEIRKSAENEEGQVAVVWDPLFMRQLNVIVGPHILNAHNVAKHLSLDHPVHVDIAHLVYFVAPNASSVDKLLKNWLEKIPEHDLRLHHVIFIPESSYVLTERLKTDSRVWSRVESVRDLPIHWFPIEMASFAHLSLPQLPCKMLIDGDWNFLYKCALALRQLEKQMPRLPTLHCKGEWSARIVEILKKIRSTGDDPSQPPGAAPPEGDSLGVGTVIILDRWLDPMTPMLSQFAFGGAIDELMGIDVQGKIRLSQADFSEKSPSSSSNSTAHTNEKPKEIGLSDDEVYAQLQDLHVNGVARKTSEFIKQLHEEENQRKSLASTAEYRSYVAKLPKVLKKTESTSTFITIASIIQRRQADDFFVGAFKCAQDILNNVHPPDKVIPFIEHAMIEARPPAALLRLVVLQSLVAKAGLKMNTLQQYRKLFLESYGVYELQWLLKLQMAGLIRVEGGNGRMTCRYPPVDYASLNRRYRLSVPEVDEIKLSDTAYIHNGRASLLVRYVEEGLRNGLQEFTRVEGTEERKESDIFEQPQTASTATPTPTKVMVFIVGGVTRSEISSIKLLSKDLAVCSTAVINGDSLLNSFKD